MLAHDTASSALPTIAGLVATDHVLPFHCCAEAVAADWPTAKQCVALGHDTPASWLALAPVGMWLVAGTGVGAAPVGVASATTEPAASAIATKAVVARAPRRDGVCVRCPNRPGNVPPNA